MNFEEQPVPTTCDTCRYIAEQGGTTTALDAYEVLRRTQESLRGQVAELESTLHSYSDDCAFMDQARARIAELEAERDNLKSWIPWHIREEFAKKAREFDEARERIAALEALLADARRETPELEAGAFDPQP